MDNQRQFAILSAERTERGPVVNADLSQQLHEQLTERGIPHAAVQGCYMGSSERAFLCVLPDDVREHARVLGLLGQLGARYSQECILLCDSNRQACFLPVLPRGLLGSPQHLGSWREVSQAEAEREQCYTLAAGRYFVTAPALATGPARLKHENGASW